MNWVLINKLCELYGFTNDAVYAYIKKGKWIAGKHYKKAPNGRIFFSPKEIDSWIERG